MNQPAATPDLSLALISAAVALADTLGAENEALRALDVARAVALLDRKRAALLDFTAASRAARALSDEQQALARQVAGRLAEAAATNKRLLERAIAVQGEVIATLARAIPQPSRAQGYGRAARASGPGRATPIALRADT